MEKISTDFCSTLIKSIIPDDIMKEIEEPYNLFIGQWNDLDDSLKEIILDIFLNLIGSGNNKSTSVKLDSLNNQFLDLIKIIDQSLPKLNLISKHEAIIIKISSYWDKLSSIEKTKISKIMLSCIPGNIQGLYISQLCNSFITPKDDDDNNVLKKHINILTRLNNNGEYDNILSKLYLISYKSRNNNVTTPNKELLEKLLIELSKSNIDDIYDNIILEYSKMLSENRG